MTQVQVAQHPSTIENYIRQGWSLVPIPQGTKGPRSAGWNQRQNALQSQSQLPPGYGIGLAHAYSGTMALDIDSWDAASQMLGFVGVNLSALYDAPDAVVIDSGRQGRGKLLYSMPFGLALPSKKVSAGDQTIYELRCATASGLTVQDVLPPSIHPQTNQPYRWAGHGHWTRLPTIPMPLLTLWQSLLAQDTKVITPASATHADWSEIKELLEYISPDCSRDEWVAVGMSLHHAGTSTGEADAALHLWNEWSKPSPKYPGEREIMVQWRSFRSDKTSTVKLGTLYRLAQAAGWKRPTPDVTVMFGSVGEITPPAQLTIDLKLPAPEIDMSLIPEVLRDRANEIGVGMGCDPVIPLFAGIAAVSAAMDARSRLELKPDFQVPPVLWIMTIGEPADKKSPASGPMFKVFSQLEDEDRPRYAQALQQYEALEARHEAARKAYLAAATDTDSLLSGEIPAGYGEPPPKPAPLKIVVSDITSQKLVRRAVDMPRGMLLYLDEMLSWAKKVMDPRSGEVRSAWTQSYESTTYEMDRVGAGPIYATNYALTIYGNLQPHVFSDVVTGMSEDGMLQRFIPVMVRPHLAKKGKPTRDQTIRNRYEQMLRTVYGLPAMTYSLSPEAAQQFDQFQDWFEAAKVDERLLHSGPIFMTAFGKLEGMVGRLALVWHVMTDPFTTIVSGETMARVIRLARSYIVPAMRYAYDSELGGVTGLDQWIADYVIQHSDKPVLTLSEIKHSARRQFKTVSTWTQDQLVLQSMYLLEGAKWVARMDDGSDLNKHMAQWAVNPHLKDAFADHRRNTIDAKQRRRDEIYRLSPKEKPSVYGAELLALEQVA